MQFEMAQGMVADGVASAPVWHALVDAVAKHQMDTSPYDYVIVSESLPETLYVWQDGKFYLQHSGEHWSAGGVHATGHVARGLQTKPKSDEGL